MKNISRNGTIFILCHGAVSLLHEIAHRMLPVTLPLVKYVIAYAFLGVLPLIALVLLWTSFRRAGVWLLLFSMAGSLLFAGYHHFVLHGPDHIFGAPHGAWLPVFQVTAVLLLILEAFGCWLSFRFLGRMND
jgi:hypothetical protein